MRLFLVAAILICTVGSHAGLCQSRLTSGSNGGYIGVVLGDLNPDRAAVLKMREARGAEVRAVQEGSPAYTAKIEAGDVLLSYNGENILGAEQLVRLVQETPAGRKVEIQFWRAGKVRVTVLTTGSRPPPTSDASASVPGFTFSESRLYTAPVDIPRPVLVWTNLLLGIEFEQIDSQLAEYFGVPGGVLIRAVEKGSPAEKSGLKTGDVIVSVRHKDLMNARDLTSGFRQAGTAVAVSLMRNHKKVDLTLTPLDAQ